jgi:redox-sensitive bicupin YhaK (pirin superfamily)
MRYIERSEDRGKSDLGWLHSRFTYSFAEYWNPKRMGFGLLRVVNDDIVDPENGFPLHHHEDMEIVTVMLGGVLTHEDSMGNKKTISAGEVQVMSAGTGVNHSEWNHEKADAARLLQIWIMPKEKRLTPRYDQKKFDEEEMANQFTVLVSGIKKEGALFIHQDATFVRARIEAGKSAEHTLQDPTHGVLVFMINGTITLGNDELSARDVMEITDEAMLVANAKESANVLLIEIPLT